MTPVLALMLLAALPDALEPHADAQQTAVGRPSPNIGATVGVRLPTAFATIDVSAGMSRNLDVTIDDVAKPAIAACASLTWKHRGIEARVGGTLENGDPRLDAALSVGALTIESEGTSILRVFATFEL